MTHEIIASIPRINCSGCVKNVTRALQALPGVEVMAADTSTKMVHLRYLPEQTGLETMKEALQAANYPITEIRSVSEAAPQEAGH